MRPTLRLLEVRSQVRDRKHVLSDNSRGIWVTFFLISGRYRRTSRCTFLVGFEIEVFITFL
jgi:hypothetical protein